jgi:uncharacterized membrane protein YccC
VGTVAGLVLAAIVAFAVLPGSGAETFFGLSAVLAACLVPLGALLASARQPWQIGLFTAMNTIFMPLLALTNVQTYNVEAFYNQSLGILVGAGTATLAFRLIPPLSPAYRVQRLLRLMLGDLRRLLRRRVIPPLDAWDGRGIGRLSGLPDSATPLQRARVLAAILVGAEIIRLRRGARRFGLSATLEPVLACLALGDIAGASDGLERLDQQFAAEPTPTALRARAHILAISGALAQHAPYFQLLATA